MALKNIDRSNMRRVILDFPKQFKIGLDAAKNVFLKPGVLTRWPENIIVCGMGGSGLPGDILATLKPLDIVSYKDYRLPPQAGNESLIISISYSGNTEETLSSFQEAVKRGLPLLSITTGGKLKKLSKKYGVSCVKLPKNLIPSRLALGEMFAALAQVLVNHNILSRKIPDEIIKLGPFLKSGKTEKQGKKLAEKIFQKIPFIYAPRRFREIAWVWKNSLNETAKILAVANYFPELNHNETVGFWRMNERQLSNKKIYVIVLRDREGSHPRILKQMKITKDIVGKEGVKAEFIDIKGETMLEKIFSTTLLGFWTAYWSALKYKIDPTSIEIIKEFKRRLAEK